MQSLLLLFVDLCLVVASTLGALVLRDNLEFSAERLLQLLPYLAITIAAAVPVFLLTGVNRALWRFSSLPDYVRIAFAAVATVSLAMESGFMLNRLDGVARSLPILQGLLMAMALVAVRVAMRLRHAQRYRVPSPVRPVSDPQEILLIVGLNAVSELFLRSLEEVAGDRIKVAGLLGQRERHRGRLLRLHPILGLPEELAKVLGDLEVHGVTIDRIVVTTRLEQLSATAQQQLLDVERTSGIRLDFFADRAVLGETGRGRETQALGPKPSDKREDALPVIEPTAVAARHYFWWKRQLDLAAAGVALVVLAPVIVLVAIVVALDAGLPAIFWQQRTGLRQRPFKLFKFRTMRNAFDHTGQRRSDTERSTLLGPLLRRTRLDELPQLYNILIGEMSFVGPRPLLPEDQMPGFEGRHAVRPGLTGWAQVKGGRDLTISDKAALDLWYVQNASLALDLAIMAKTLHMVAFGERTDRKAIHQAWSALGLDRGKSHQRANEIDGDRHASVAQTQATPTSESVSRWGAARKISGGQLPARKSA